jgi:outer membrane protein assembly factor BamB
VDRLIVVSCDGSNGTYQANSRQTASTSRSVTVGADRHIELSRSHESARQFLLGQVSWLTRTMSLLMSPRRYRSEFLAAGLSSFLTTLILALVLVGSASGLAACGGHAAAVDTNPPIEDRMPNHVAAWPTWRFNTARTGVGPNIVVPNPNTADMLWKQQEIVKNAAGELTPFGDLIEYPPSISDGKVFYCTNGGGQGGQVICRKLTTGAELWRYKIPARRGGQFAAEPAVSGNVVYVGTMGPHKGRGDPKYRPQLLALQADTMQPDGHLLWSYTTGHAVESSPMVLEGRLYFSTQAGTLYCFSATPNAGNPKPIWTRPLGGKTTSSPAYDQNGRIITSTYTGVVWALDKDSGKILWRTKVPGTNAKFYGTPAVYGVRVVVASLANGKLYCLDDRNGHILWTCATGQGMYASPAVWNNTIYIGSKFKCFWAIDVRTGKPIWSKTKILSNRYPGSIWGSASVLDGIVYFSSRVSRGKGITYAIDGRTGARKWQFNDGYYSPVTATSTVALITGHHTIYAFKTSP